MTFGDGGSKSDLALRGVALLLVLGSVLGGCLAGDLDTLCALAHEIRKNDALSRQRQVELLERRMDEKLSRFGRVREVLEEAADDRGQERYERLRRGLSELGGTSWQCPALQELLKKEKNGT